MSQLRYWAVPIESNVQDPNSRAHKFYVAITDVCYGMEDFSIKGEPNTSYDVCRCNDIHVPYNKCCCVYQMDIEVIDGWMQVTRACGYLCGSTDLGTNEFDWCDVNNIASSDNLIWL